MRRTLFLVTLLPLLLATTVREAHAADDGGDVAKARKIFADGVRLYQNGDYEGARRLFHEADVEHHAPAITYNIGLAEEKLAHPQNAVDAYEQYLTEAGDKGDLASAAATAIAQIKAHSTRLRLETKPSGAHLFVDGSALKETAPSNMLVPAGHHLVVAQGDGWRGEKEVEATGAADVISVLIEGAETPPKMSTAIDVPPAQTPRDPPPPPPTKDLPPPSNAERVVGTGAPDGLTWGATFAVAPAYLLGVTNPAADNAKAAVSVAAGPILEIGYALTERFEFLARGFVGLGPDAKPAYVYMGGPGLTYRIGSIMWVGASFVGGRFDTRAHDARYDTDIVFGAMLEASFVLLKKPSGEWLAGIQPAMLLTEMRNDNTTFFFPLSFGYRSF